MRKLKTSDIPAFCRCLKKLGIKDKIKDIAKEADSVKDAWTRGFDLVWDIFDLATEADGEKALYAFLARPFEMTPEAVEDLDIEILMNNIKQLATENNLLSFFKFAAKSTK